MKNNRLTPVQLESACMDCDFVDWHGLYHGRWHFKGYAVVCNDSSDLVELTNRCHSKGFQLPPPDHQDSMGFNTLFAWSERLFKEPPVRTQHKFRTFGEAG